VAPPIAPHSALCVEYHTLVSVVMILLDPSLKPTVSVSVADVKTLSIVAAWSSGDVRRDWSMVSEALVAVGS
jgi:hypothetical protein